MSKLSPNEITPNTNTSPFIPLIENGSKLRTGVLELDDRIQAADECGKPRWMTLRNFLAANTAYPQSTISPMERLKQIVGTSSHEDGDKVQTSIKVRLQKNVLGAELTATGELRISSELLRFAKKQEAIYSAGQYSKYYSSENDAFRKEYHLIQSICINQSIQSTRRMLFRAKFLKTPQDEAAWRRTLSRWSIHNQNATTPNTDSNPFKEQLRESVNSIKRSAAEFTTDLSGFLPSSSRNPSR